VWRRGHPRFKDRTDGLLASRNCFRLEIGNLQIAFQRGESLRNGGGHEENPDEYPGRILPELDAIESSARPSLMPTLVQPLESPLETFAGRWIGGN
jgi:hypothetical protein